MLFVHNAIHSCMEISNNKLSLLKGFSGYMVFSPGFKSHSVCSCCRCL